MFNIMKEAELIDKVNSAIEQIRPFLKNDGGDMELIEITSDYKVRVKLLGSCKNCSISPVTLKAGLEEALKIKAPEISGVEAIEQ